MVGVRDLDMSLTEYSRDISALTRDKPLRTPGRVLEGNIPIFLDINCERFDSEAH